MAIYHFHAKTITRSKGQSATASAAYRSGEVIRDMTTGQTHDYTAKRGVVHTEILLPEGAPERLKDRQLIWNLAEASEKRKDAQLAREIEIAIPAELSREKQVELVREYAGIFTRDGMIADVCIHDKEDGNPHAHIMLTTREWDEDRATFGAKRRDWNERSKLEMWRETWATMTNNALERAGIDDRIDHRTLEAQGIDREPTIHHGNRQGLKEINKEIKKRNDERAAMRAELADIDAEISAIDEAERAAREAESKRPRTRQEQIAALDERIEKISKQIDANKKRIDELTERREQGAKDLPSTDIELKEARARAADKRHAYQYIYDDANELLNSGDYDVARKGLFNALKKALGFEYDVDVEATSDVGWDIRKAQDDAEREIIMIDKDLEEEEAAIMRKARIRYDDLCRSEREERAKLEQENQELGPEMIRCIHERNTIDNRISQLDMIRAKLEIVERGSPIDYREELEAANLLRRIGAEAAKSKPRDDEILDMLQPQAQQIMKLAAEYDERKKERSKQRGRYDFER